MTRAPKSVRAPLEALEREFRKCSDLYSPLYHELFCSGPDLSEYEVQDVCNSFRQAFADKFDDAWEEWHGPDDVSFFGRFFGDSEGLEQFIRLSESAYLVVCKIGPSDPNFENFVYPPEYGYHGWLKFLNDMAFGYPTPLLRCEYGFWNESEQACTEEELARLGTPEDGGTPYPIHPFHWRLAHSVFTSSAAAIELILDDDRGLLIGDHTSGFPVSFSEPSGGREAVSGGSDTTKQDGVAVEQQGGFRGPIEDQDTPILKIITNRLDVLEGASDSGITDGPTPFGDLWHDGHKYELGLTQLEIRLLNALWKSKQREIESVCEDVYGEDDLKYSGIRDVKKRVNKKFRDGECPLCLKTKGEVYYLIETQAKRNEEGEQQQ